MRDGRLVYFYPATGEIVEAPEGALPPNALSREDAAFQRDITIFGNLNRNNPLYMADPAKLVADAEAYAARQAATRAQRQTGQAPATPTSGPEIRDRPF